MKKFVLKYAIAGLCLGSISACALAPNEAEPSWTDARLEAFPPTEAPRTVTDQRMAPQLRAQVAAASGFTLMQRDEVIGIGLLIQPPSLGMAAFVVQARDRATPPDPK